jgi:hypothetical protein
MSIKFGPIFHLGYAVPDLDKTIDYMSRVMGIGPFFIERHVTGDNEQYVYKGKPIEQDVTVAHAFTGEMDIELICPNIYKPSPIVDYLAKHPEGGVQHLGVLIDSDKWQTTLADPEVKSRMVLEGFSGSIRLAFMDGFSMGATPLELIEATPEIRQKFARLKQMCAAWDGTEPMRGKR